MTAPAPRELRPADLFRLAVEGLRARRLRAGLSALGISIGVAAIVAVLGLSASSQAALLAEIARLGTNLLTVSTGQKAGGGVARLPAAAPAMISRLPGVTDVQHLGTVPDAKVYRSPHVPAINTNGLAVNAASLGLPAAVGAKLARGAYLNAATEREPVVVLGAGAAQLLGIDRAWPGQRIWLGGRWFYVAGILAPSVLIPTVDASVFVGYPAARRYLGFDGHPTTVYLRTRSDRVTGVHALLAAQANPENPGQVSVGRPSAALVAQAAAESAMNGLFLGLGAVALLVGAIGVANIMVISVLERRGEIGLRRALGATRGHIRTQFLAEAVLLALAGGAAGVSAGALTTAVYATTRGWAVVIPPLAWAGGLGAALLIGAAAGLLPALRAARLSPVEALWSV
ncbi:ABC transporter permease [Bailinhaonella thermotolerans]|uniref:ABC transporter permease n=1 Tax=Bailinhaonella thermotolerans TaxID=1070861 RepID=A0A3A4AU38_9ACTN|nr:ABC transporter permease [Bailinhaonella thermotolerans]RJL33065.1 ABC transporter permease [Bailinhaonella thermotolerans]